MPPRVGTGIPRVTAGVPPLHRPLIFRDQGTPMADPPPPVVVNPPPPDDPPVTLVPPRQAPPPPDTTAACQQANFMLSQIADAQSQANQQLAVIATNVSNAKNARDDAIRDAKTDADRAAAQAAYMQSLQDAAAQSSVFNVMLRNWASSTATWNQRKLEACGS